MCEIVGRLLPLVRTASEIFYWAMRARWKSKYWNIDTCRVAMWWKWLMGWLFLSLSCFFFMLILCFARECFTLVAAQRREQRKKWLEELHIFGKVCNGNSRVTFPNEATIRCHTNSMISIFFFCASEKESKYSRLIRWFLSVHLMAGLLYIKRPTDTNYYYYCSPYRRWSQQTTYQWMVCAVTVKCGEQQQTIASNLVWLNKVFIIF